MVTTARRSLHRPRAVRFAGTLGLGVALAAAFSLPRLDAAPGVRVETAALDLAWTGFGTFRRDVALDAPVPLSGVSAVNLDAVVVEVDRGTPRGRVSTRFQFELLAGGAVAVALNEHVFDGGTQRGALALRTGTLSVSSNRIADAIRVTLVVAPIEEPSGDPTVSIRGLHEGNVARAVFVIGAIGTTTAHRLRVVNGPFELTAEAGGSSPWHEFRPASPAPAADLRYVFGFCPGVDARGLVSGTSETRLVLDDGSFLVLDDVASPSLGMPVEGRIGSCHSLLVPESGRARLADRRIVGWDTRVHAAGSGSFTVRGSQMSFLFAHDPPSRFVRGDCNLDGRVSGQVADATFLLGYLFRGGDDPRCPAACDSDANGKLDITDAIRVLAFNFLGGAPPAPPFPDCGTAGDADLACAEGSAACP